jgi:hypothetical protein
MWQPTLPLLQPVGEAFYGSRLLKADGNVRLIICTGLVRRGQEHSAPCLSRIWCGTQRKITSGRGDFMDAV